MSGLRRFRRVVRRGVAALMAVAVLGSGVEAVCHAHAPHGEPAAGQAARAQDEHGGLATCSICRLAHQTSSVPLAPSVVDVPAEPVLVLAAWAPAVRPARIAPGRSPRAPPATSAA